MPELVTCEIAGPIATITMDDGKANALSPAMQAALHGALDLALAEGSVVVLRGRDGMFSAGFDLGVLAAGGQESIDMVIGGFELLRRLLTHPRPLVVACTGHAVAMGAFLLLTGDHRIGPTTPTKFAANEVAIGMTMPWSAIAVLSHRLDPGARDRVVLLADTLGPEAAVAAGFLDETVAPEQVTARATAVAERLAELHPRAHAETKQRWRQPLLDALDQAITADRADLARVLAPTDRTVDRSS